VKWLVGFTLGVLGGWALGWIAGPNGARLGTGQITRLLGASDVDEAGADRSGSGRTFDGLLADDRLTRAARGRIQERGIDDLRVDVTTVDGVMYLRGRPRTARDAAAIVDVAETTPGVERVVNELKPLDAVEAAQKPSEAVSS
jgi:BON domain